MANGFFGRDSEFNKSSGALPNIQDMFGDDMFIGAKTHAGVMEMVELFRGVDFIVKENEIKGHTVLVRKDDFQTPVLKLHGTENKGLYNAGLERNHKPLVNMLNLAYGICALLNCQSNIDIMTPQAYDSAITAYKPFIQKSVLYATVAEALKHATW
jgi:hypothetical protein